MAFLSVKIVGNGTPQNVSTNSGAEEGVINSLVAYNTTGGDLSFDVLLDGDSFINKEVLANDSFWLTDKLNVGPGKILTVNAPTGVNVTVSYFKQTVDPAGALNGAQQAALEAIEAYDNFDDRYLGPKASDPTLDNDGEALITGALYFNTATPTMMVYNGATWQIAVGIIDPTFTIIREPIHYAEPGQTVFNLATTYSTGLNAMMVYVNGIRFNLTTDYIETDANTITFTSGLSLDDEVLFEHGVVVAGDATSANLTAFTPTGNISSTNVQDALAETDTTITALQAQLQAQLDEIEALALAGL